LKVAPVAAGRAVPEDGNDGGGPPNRKTMIAIGLAALALVVIVALFFLLSGGDSDEEESNILSPSIDCTNTDLASHGIICASEVLRAREIELSDLYLAVLAQAEGQQRVALQQGYAAYQSRRDGCQAANCIATVYDAREGELGQYDLPVQAEAAAAAVEEAPAEAVPETQTVERPADTRPAERVPAAERPSTPVETRPTPSETRPAPQPDSPRATRTTPPQPIGNPGSWVRASDYPANVLRNGEQGTSRYQVRVGANGVPTACFTTGSSGHFQLDARACNMVMSRARFQPGRDASGNPAAGLYSGSHSWRAPR
jgi:TonB family protein